MIFILGGRGFVGSGFVRACEEAGEDYAIIDRASYGQRIGQRCDILVNANGNSSKLFARQRPLDDFDASWISATGFTFISPPATSTRIAPHRALRGKNQIWSVPPSATTVFTSALPNSASATARTSG